VQLLLATRNPHKTREFAELLGSEFQINDLSAATFAAVEETGKTFVENAILKAVAGSRSCDGLVIADDSGLEVNALGGGPGIFSARYAGENASNQRNIEKLLRELASSADRSARFRCVIALVRDGKVMRTFEGLVEGEITDQPHGAAGFGYDPVFVPTGDDRTFAEIPAEVKNQLSHRAKAAAALREYLLETFSPRP
jgi:XTP/dITP diphosphohydrolase